MLFMGKKMWSALLRRSLALGTKKSFNIHNVDPEIVVIQL